MIVMKSKADIEKSKAMEFPVLYGKPTKGDKIKRWEIKIQTEDDIVRIVRIHGYEGHKMTESKKEIKGKNKGKKNQTSDLQQAEKEAESMWKKQKESGYSETKENLHAEFLPMLAHDYNKRGKDIKFPCYVQPKIDGVRLTCDNKGILKSRTGKPYIGFEHITDAVKKLNLPDDYIIDGELFTFDVDFETLCSICRKSKTIDPNQHLLKFYIFDIYTADETPFEERLNYLKSLKLSDPLYLVETSEVKEKEGIDEKQEEYLVKQFEGLMLRNKGGLYKANYRSADLQKYKQFVDSEYKIVSCKEATGNDKGTVIFICESHCGEHKFSVRPRGSREQRKEWLNDFDSLCKNKLLTVRYQNLTEAQIPRFPVGIQIRDYE